MAAPADQAARACRGAGRGVLRHPRGLSLRSAWARQGVLLHSQSGRLTIVDLPVTCGGLKWSACAISTLFFAGACSERVCLPPSVHEARRTRQGAKGWLTSFGDWEPHVGPSHGWRDAWPMAVAPGSVRTGPQCPDGRRGFPPPVSAASGPVRLVIGSVMFGMGWAPDGRSARARRGNSASFGATQGLVFLAAMITCMGARPPRQEAGWTRSPARPGVTTESGHRALRPT